LAKPLHTLHGDVRAVHLEALGRVVGPGDIAAALGVSSCICDPSSETRTAAVNILRHIRCKTNAVIASITPSLGDANPGVRTSAVEALCAVAEVGDTHAIAAAAIHFEDRSWGVRRSAAEVVRRLAAGPEEQAIAADLVFMVDRQDESLWHYHTRTIRQLLERCCETKEGLEVRAPLGAKPAQPSGRRRIKQCRTGTIVLAA